MNILEYKGYEGTAEIDISREVCRGKILFINDLVTYESATLEGFRREFENAVDDYIETCAALGREPQRPCRGQFNVRIPPATHKAAVIRAHSDGVSLNEVTSRALECYLNAKSDVNNNYHFAVTVIDEKIKTLTTYASVSPQWGLANVH